MHRPCFLVLDREFSSGISSRKLVIETAKFNVITAYSANEALEVLAKFLAIDGAVIDSHIEGMQCGELIAKLKQIKSRLPIVVVGPEGDCDAADYHVESFNPVKLLEVLQKLRPEETLAIAETNKNLNELES